jgi:hypothetical protein
MIGMKLVPSTELSERRGRGCGWTNEELLPGQLWHSEVDKAIRESDVIVVLLSMHVVAFKGFRAKELEIIAKQSTSRQGPSGRDQRVPTCNANGRCVDRQWCLRIPSERSGDRYLCCDSPSLSDFTPEALRWNSAVTGNVKKKVGPLADLRLNLRFGRRNAQSSCVASPIAQSITL